MFEISRLTRLHLGREGESNARPIEIDMTDWLTEWPGAAVGLLLMRPGEDTFYAAKTKTEDGVMRYVPTRADLEIPGDGMAQIVLTGDNDVELRSRVVKTEVEASLPGSVAGTPEEPMQPFVGQVLDAAARAEKAAKDAEEHKLDGVSPIVETSKAGKVTTITITDAEGVKIATITDGKDGDDGVSPIVVMSKAGKVTTITITDATGTKTATITDGKDGQDGDDGKTATVRIGTVTTLEPGSMATVTNTGTETDAVLNFGIPRGADGKDGENGSGTNAPAGITQHASGPLVYVKDAAGFDAVQIVSEIKTAAEGVSAVTLTHTGRNVNPLTKADVAEIAYTSTSGDSKTVKGWDIALPPGDYKVRGDYNVDGYSCYVYGIIIDAEGTATGKGNISPIVGKTEQTVDFSLGQGERLVLYNGASSDSLSTTKTKFGRVNIGVYPNGCDTTYEPYNGTTLTAELPETVYGGTLDWTAGLLTITHDADGAELSAPRTAKLAPQTLEMLKGDNNIWSDTGDTSLTYNADIKMYIDAAIAELAAAIINA